MQFANIAICLKPLETVKHPATQPPRRNEQEFYAELKIQIYDPNLYPPPDESTTNPDPSINWGQKQRRLAFYKIFGPKKKENNIRNRKYYSHFSIIDTSQYNNTQGKNCSTQSFQTCLQKQQPKNRGDVNLRCMEG